MRIGFVLTCLVALACSNNQTGRSRGKGSGGSGGSSGSTICEPGATRRCFGPGACEGAQECSPNGSAWLGCDCDDPGRSGGSGGSRAGAGGSSAGGSGGLGGTVAGGEAGASNGGLGGTVAGGEAGESNGGIGGTNDSGGAGAGADGGSGGNCTPLVCQAQNGDLRCGILTDACGNELDCGMDCAGRGTCGSDEDANTCSCGPCVPCGPGQIWYQNACCTPRTECGQNPDIGQTPLCGDSADGCGRILHCPATCPTGGACGTEGLPHLCSCWIADWETAYPCPDGLHKYSCQGQTEILMPTISGCVPNATDTSGSRWCCP